MDDKYQITYTKKQVHDLEDYDMIPMETTVKSVFEISLIDKGLGGMKFEEIPVTPYVHAPSYEEGPKDWKKMFSLYNWCFYIAYHNEKPVGAIALAYQTEGCNMLKGADDVVVIWDIRVLPTYQRQGIGSKLMDIAYAWAKEKRVRLIKVETQQINVSACKFYLKKGFHLGTIDCYAYGMNPKDEVMLLWYQFID